MTWRSYREARPRYRSSIHQRIAHRGGKDSQIAVRTYARSAVYPPTIRGVPVLARTSVPNRFKISESTSCCGEKRRRERGDRREGCGSAELPEAAHRAPEWTGPG